MSLFTVCVMTPDKILLNSDEVKEVILPTTTGRMGILGNHTAVVTGLDIGTMSVCLSGSGQGSTANDWSKFVLFGGFALVKDNKVTVVVSEANKDTDLDLETVESALSQASLSVFCCAGK